MIRQSLSNFADINMGLFSGITLVNPVLTLFLRGGADIGAFGYVLIAHPLQRLHYAPGMGTAVMMMILGHNA